MDDVDTTMADAPEAANSLLTGDDLKIMKGIVDKLAEYTRPGDPQGKPSFTDFHRLVNKRTFPDYYDAIKEPKAFSSVRSAILKKTYSSWADFVHDFALIVHNAMVYNVEEAKVFKDAVDLKEQVQLELAALVEQQIITAEDAQWPALGDLPTPDPAVAAHNAEEEDDEEDDDDEEDSDDESPKKKKQRVRKSLKREGSKLGDTKEDGVGPKTRGRPPKVHTPIEARINAVLKGLRKLRNADGDMMVIPFERLPDKNEVPQYYQEIATPIALDQIKRRAKRKHYQSVDACVRDLDLMFDNAKKFNEDESAIFKAAVELQAEAHNLAEQEKNKPDTEYVDEDGRLPLQEIMYKGELWKVGDWIHLTNANDATKPIPAQIYRTWQDAAGLRWINACWYYRPEQTVHRYEKMFFENEIVKTGKYIDHRIEDVVDKCFVMFVTRYSKGRPKNVGNRVVYVCEARYNEEKHQLNKIKTWASCVPDEVRGVDYEMDLFDQPRKVVKVPSPIKHMLPENAKEDDPLPEPQWSARNAPPSVGAVHKRPREANDSPPPEPTPSPVPAAVIDQRQVYSSVRPYDNQHGVPQLNQQAGPAFQPQRGPYDSQFADARVSASPGPSLPPLQHQNSYGSSQTGSSQMQMQPQPQVQTKPLDPNSLTSAATVLVQPSGQIAALPNSSVPAPGVSHVYEPAQIANMANAVAYARSTGLPVKNFGPDVKVCQVYVLDAENDAAISTTDRYGRPTDDRGRILWFIAAPINTGPVQRPRHSLMYWRDKVRRDAIIKDIANGMSTEEAKIASEKRIADFNKDWPF